MNLIESIEALFAENEVTPEAVVETPMEFVDVKLADGRILRVSDIAVDGTVVEINEEGEVAVEDGEYTLEDETVIKVVGGIITEVIPAAAEDNAPEEGMAPEVVTEEMEAKFMDVALKDGPLSHIVTATEGEINPGDVMMIDGVEAGPGEYYTTTGMEIIVGEAGVIAEVSAAEVEEPEAEAEVPAEEVAATEDEEISGVVNNLKNLINQIKELKSQFDELKSNFESIEKENTELKLEVSKFASAPSAEPTKTKVDFNKADKDAKLKFFAKK